MSQKIEVIFWDFGGVFTPSPFGPDNVAYAESLGVTMDHLTNLVLGYHTTDGDHPWHKLERGEATLADTFKEVAKVVHETGLTDFHMGDFFGAMGGRKPGTTKAPTGETMGKMPARPDMVALVQELRDAGVRNCIITNNVKEFSAGWRKMLDVTMFEQVVDSCEVGIRKPDPAIYHLALERMGNPASENTAFLDDFAGNLDSAAALGIHPVLVDSDHTQAIAAVRELVGL